MKDDMRVASFDQHCAMVAVVADLTARYWRGEGVNTVTAQPIHKIGKAVEDDPFIKMIVSRKNCVGAPGLVGPLHGR